MASLFAFPARIFVLRILILCSLLLLASCTQPTAFPRYVTVADVINNIKCELQLAIGNTPNSMWLSGWTAAFTVSLQVERRTGANGDLTLVVPYVNPAPGLFTLVVGGGVSKSGQARMSFTFIAEKNLGVFMAKNRCDYAQELRGRHNLAGETGLQVWFVSVIDGINRARIANQTTGFSYNLEFLTTLDGHIRPSFRTVYPSGRIFSGIFDVNHQREDKNTLNVAFAPYKAPVPFAATDLGKALARIEAELHKAREEEAVAKRAVDQAKANLQREESKSRTLRGKESAAQNLKVRELSNTTAAAERTLHERATTVRNLENERAALGASAAAAWGAAARPPVSTQEQLNNLITLDAIRDIPR